MTEPAQSTSPPIPVDIRWMRQAVALAERSIGQTSPNPAVGCILVQGDTAVGRGMHIYDKLHHAEIVALQQAGDRARGATAYVTLEPCSHFGRTGPCADALVAAGVARVVVGSGDPNPLVNGRGLARLLEAGIEVTTGVLQEQVQRQNDGFARFIRTRTPFVTLKTGVSLDGRIAPEPGGPETAPTTTYLTSPESLATVQRMRHASDAIMAGIGTVLKDNPLLTDRSGLTRRRPILRVILDPLLQIPINSRLVQTAEGDVVVYTTDPDNPKAEELRRLGLGIEGVPKAETHDSLDIRAVLDSLGRRRSILSVIAETGSRLNRALLSGDLVDKVCFFYAPLFLGDTGVPLVAGPGGIYPKMFSTSVARSGSDIYFETYLRNPWL